MRKFKVELITNTNGYYHNCEAKNPFEAIELSIIYHKINRFDILSIHVIYITE